MRAKQKLLRVIFALEIVGFAFVYYFGTHGMVALQQLQDEYTVINHDVMEQRTEIALLETEIANWQSDSFYKEKVAREQLQMARSGEQIYFL